MLTEHFLECKVGLWIQILAHLQKIYWLTETNVIKFPHILIIFYSLIIIILQKW